MEYKPSILVNFLVRVCILSEASSIISGNVIHKSSHENCHTEHEVAEVLFRVRNYDGVKSERMCNRYTIEACNGVLSIKKTPQNAQNPVAETTTEAEDGEIHISVVGGRLSAPKEYPHMALIGYEDGSKIDWSCGGSLISHNYVLSAAHCTSSSKGNPSRIRLGELNLATTTDDAKTVDYPITQIIVHPHYHPPALYHDIVLFKFKGISAFTDYIRPICLNTFLDFGTNKVTAVGWGDTGYGEKSSDELLSVELDLQENGDCNSLYTGKDLPNGFNESTQICVGFADGGKDTCQGDSGGPLQILNELAGCSRIYKQIGIVSFGENCALPDTPAVYTRVSYYIPWIESIVWK